MITGATGAPLEQIRTIAIGIRLTDLLRANGFEVYHTDAFADNNPDVTDKDWDLFLALHCDANYAGDEGGGFFDWIDPSIDSTPESNKESKRIMDAMISVYFTDTGIRNVEARRNANTKFYYMWDELTAKTSCVIVEMGESIDPHDNVILNDTDRVAKALLRGIMIAFGVTTQPIPTPPTPPTDPCANVKQQLDDSKKALVILQTSFNNFQIKTTNELAEKDSECKRKLQDIKTKSINFINGLNP